MTCKPLPIRSVDLWTGTFEITGKVVSKHSHETFGTTPRFVMTTIIADGCGSKDAIELTAWETHVARVDGLLQEGQVVTVRNAKVGRVKGKQYTALAHDHVLQVAPTTEIVVVANSPLEQLQFCPPLTKLSNLTMQQQLCNVMAVVKDVGELTNRESRSVMRRLSLTDDSQCMAPMVLWGEELAGTVGAELAQKLASKQPCVMLVWNAITSTYQGNFQLSTIANTRITVQPAHARAVVLADWFAHVNQDYLHPLHRHLAITGLDFQVNYRSFHWDNGV